MKTTAICRFDGTAILHVDNEDVEFENYEKLEKYADEKEIKLQIVHFHPGGLRRQENGG